MSLVKQNHFRYIMLINLAMLCVSTSGALGRYISLPPPLTIWYRAVFALIFLGIFCIYKKYSFAFDVKKHGVSFFLSGFFMAAHWVTYFYALKWSNVAIGMLSLFTYPIISALLEPIFFKSKFYFLDIFLGAIILVGIYFLVPSFDINDDMTKGLLIGLLSALCFALRNLMLKSRVKNYNGSILMFYQMIVTLVLLTPVMFYYPQSNVGPQIPFLLFLGLVTTAIGHTLFLNTFQYFTISTASIMSSVQPIFGILIAIIFLNEMPNLSSIIGGALILITVIIEGKRAALRESE